MDFKFSSVLRFACALAVVALLLLPVYADAQETRPSLLNAVALQRATEVTSSRSSRTGSIVDPIYGRSERGSAADMQPETVEDALGNIERRDQFMNRYRGLLYLKYVSGVSDSPLYEDLESSSLTEKLVVFQIGDSFIEALKTSPVAELYRSAVRKVKVVKDYTTVQVNRGESLNVDTGTKRVPGKSLLQFRIRANPRQGIEPRLEIGDTLAITYDVLQQQTLIGCDFEF